MPIYGSKFGGKKKKDNFFTSQKLLLNSPANGQLVTYSKIHTKVCRNTLGYTYGLILDQISESQVPLRHCKCAEKYNFFSMAPSTPLSVSPPPQNGTIM